MAASVLPRIAASVLILLAAAPTAVAGVWIVDASGAGDFTDLQPAVNAAAPGDLILVKPASTPYGAFKANGKPLSIVGDGPGLVSVETTCRIGNMPAGSSFLLRGFLLDDDFGPNTGLKAGLRIDNNAGHVWVEDCEIQSDLPFALNFPGLRVLNSSRVVFVRTRVEKEKSIYASVHISSSTTHMFDCVVRGADSESPLLPGDPALEVFGSTLLASGSTFEGGNGLDGAVVGTVPGQLCLSGGPGGAALSINSLSKFISIGNTIIPGAGGVFDPPGGGWGACSDGDPGPSFQTLGVYQPLPGLARNYSIASPVRAGTTADRNFEGEPGDAVATLTSFAPEAIYALDVFGTLLTAWPIIVTFEGILPVSGQLTVQEDFELFPMALTHLQLYQQIFVFTSSGSPQLGGGSALTILNQAL